MVRFIDRRRFLSGSVACGAGLVILGNPASAWSYQANQKLNVALVGVGGRGTWFVDTIPRLENVVALCDVNQQKISEAMKHWEETGKRYAASPNDWERSAGAEFRRLAETKPKTFADFRKMLDEMGKQIERGRCRHARPFARGGFRGGHQGRQAGLLREAADAHAF